MPKKHLDNCEIDDKLELSRETVEQLYKFLMHQYIPYKYEYIHSLISQMHEFVDKTK